MRFERNVLEALPSNVQAPVRGRRRHVAARGRKQPATLAALLGAAGSLVVPAPAAALTTLTVDLSQTVRPATHVGNGSLYGVTESLPADVDALIAPLHPNMFTGPAADQQQPWGDAIVVAGRVAPTGAKVTIRLADWFKGWYSFTNIDDWLGKIGQTVSRKQAANLQNVYAYEIWNEPNGTWKSDKPISFNELWRQSFAKLRQLDPQAKITGPSLAGYDGNFMKDFLSFCKTNACLPDIVGWHEGEYISNDVKSYRDLERQLGIGPLPITINEYSGSGRIDDEGRPGASAPLIAQLERSGVETACITYWDVPHPGRLGTLLATDTERNGGWFFYRWYGEMTGQMVATSSSLPVNGKNLDGVASLDASAGDAFVILGGVNDGSVEVVVKGFSAAPFFGSRVHAVVERTPFADRSTVVNTTETLSGADVAIVNDAITISIGNTNGNDGYRLSLTPLGGAPGTAGTGGSGSSAGSGGAPGTGGDGGGTVSLAGTGGAPGGTSAGAGGGRGPGGTGSGETPDAGVGGGRGATGGVTGLGLRDGVGGSDVGVVSGGDNGALASGATASKPSSCSCSLLGAARGSHARGRFWMLALGLLALRRQRSRERSPRRRRDRARERPAARRARGTE